MLHPRRFKPPHPHTKDQPGSPKDCPTRCHHHRCQRRINQRQAYELFHQYEENGNSKPVTEADKCGKKYTKVTKGGYSQVQHGYLYEFQVMPNYKCPKDAFLSLVKYKKDPPRAIIYHLACALSSYCLSSEPYFYRQTQFFHDICHQYNLTFRLSRFSNLQVNSEIAEQFNSYIKRFKYTSTHSSVDKYSFLMQYAIHKS